jgi:peptide/nickel transport system permease protein
MFRNYVAVAIIALFVIAGILAPFIAPYSPLEVKIEDRLQAPSLSHPLGTDTLGRDVFSRIVYSTRTSMLLGLVCILLSFIIGTGLGIIAGYKEGVFGTLVMAAVDMVYAVPFIIIVLLVVVTLGTSISNVVLTIVFLFWARFARVIRGETLSIKQSKFIALAQTSGCSELSIMIRHILPNVINTAIVLAVMNISYVILTEAIMSFLGVGIPLTTPSWGNMVSEGSHYVLEAPWITVFPSLAIFVFVFALMSAGEQLRIRLDPTLRMQ